MKKPKKTTPSPMRRAFTVLGCVGCAGLLCAVFGSFFAPIEAIVILLLGWIKFLARVGPEITVNWVSVVSGV